MNLPAKEASTINDIINKSQHIVVIQADNPDGDSLSSALALEQIIADLDKTPYLYCAVDIPDYLRHLEGWDRVSKVLPSKFDASIVVDTSANVLLEKLNSSEYKNWVASKPVIIIDHHAEVNCDIPYAKVVLNDKNAVATGEVIYKLADQLKWPLNLQSKTFIASSVLSDSLGLTSELVTADTYRLMADLTDAGVDRPALEEARRELSKMPAIILKYKADLIKRTELLSNGRIALVIVPHDELMQYSPLYNPAPLIQNDMLSTENVKVAIVLKNYKDGKVTGSIRCGIGTKIAADLAGHFGGGGHIYAAGFKIDKAQISKVKSESIQIAEELLDKSK